jgi:glutamate racemase
MSNAPIGIFDSGIGGLTVTRAIFQHLPAETTIYFGDTARVPYGPKSPETVCRYSAEILDWLLSEGVKAVVVACNTSSAHALPSLIAASPVPVLGVIGPGARAACRATRGGVIGVIGTAGTVRSNAYHDAIRDMLPAARVEQTACPLFVPLVEEGWFEHQATRLAAQEYLGPMVEHGLDTLVLGCTHYPLLKQVLHEVAGPEVVLIDSAEETAHALQELLTAEGLNAPTGTVGTHRFAVSDDEQRFLEVGARFVGEKLRDVELVALG